MPKGKLPAATGSHIRKGPFWVLTTPRNAAKVEAQAQDVWRNFSQRNGCFEVPGFAVASY